MNLLKPLSCLILSHGSRSIKQLTNVRVLACPGNHRRFFNSNGSIRQQDNNGSQNSNSTTSDFIEEDEDDENAIFSREFAEVSLKDFESLYQDDESVKDHVATVLKEYEFFKYNSMGRVPSKLDVIDMQLLLKEGPTPSKREKLINFLYKREMAKRTAHNRKLRDKKERSEIREVKVKAMEEKFGGVRSGLLTPDGDIIYGLWHNSLIPRIPENKMKSGKSIEALIGAALFGKKLIFDFDFEKHMEPWVSRNATEQVVEAYGINRFHYKEPCDLWFCNFREEENGPKYLVEKALKQINERSMITVKNDCFTNHFDKSRLVYLSPNASQKLTGDIAKNDDIYIIGVYNDKNGPKPLTFRKAEAMGIRSRKLPIDNYLAWHGGSKSLCINHVVGIINEVLANGGDWRSALMKNIPERKLKKIDVLVEQERIRKSKHIKIRSRPFSLRDDFLD